MGYKKVRAAAYRCFDHVNHPNEEVHGPRVDFCLLTCTKYVDVAVVSAAAWDRNLSQCDLRRIIFSDYEPQVEIAQGWGMQKGERTGWAKNLERCIKGHGGKYIILVLDDFLCRRPVEPRPLNDAIAYCVSEEIDLMTMSTRVKRGELISRDPIEIHKNDDHRFKISLQPGIWRVGFLLELLESVETPWEFEVKNSARALPTAKLLVAGDLLNYQGLLSHHMVEKGRWIWSERCLAKCWYKLPVGAKRDCISFWGSAVLELREILRKLEHIMPFVAYKWLAKSFRKCF